MATVPVERGLIVGKLRQYARPIRGAAIFVHATLNRLVAYRDDGEIVDLEGFHRIQKASSTGDILYRNATSYRPLPVGATGEVLTVAGGVPSWQTAGGGGGAPTTADYLVRTADAGLSAERVVTDTASVVWDWGTGGQAKATVPDMVGDSGSGGVAGLVPAPAAGDGIAQRYLSADGTWQLPPAGGRPYYLDPADASDIATYYTARTSPSPTAESTSASALTGTSPVLIYQFATEPGEPGAILLPAGTALRHFHCATGAANQVATITVEIYTCASDGTGATLRRTDTTAAFSGAAVQEILGAFTDPSGYTILATDRLLIKVYGSRVSGPATCNLTVYWNGTSRAAFVTSTILQAAPIATLVETSGPTVLTMGAVADGQALFRVGSTAVGGYVGLSVADIGTNYYPGCMHSGGALVAGLAIGQDLYKGVPWLCLSTRTIDRLAIDVTTAVAASNAVIAMWSNTSSAPGTVLGQGTVSTATTGVKAVTVSISVVAGTVYWFTLLTSVLGVRVRGPAVASLWPSGGYALSGAAPMAIYQVAQVYSSPAPAWPGGATWVDTAAAFPVVFYRLSA